MQFLGFLLYYILTRIYFGLLYLVAPLNARAKLLINGQKEIFNNLSQISDKLKTQKICWFHCASLGEFEQGKPVMLELKKLNYQILVTFFSPSGYEQKKNDPTADYIFYLPFDRYNNAKKFISLVEPKMVFWVKYDFWFFYLNQLKKQQIPVFLISALYRNDQLFFKWYGKFYLNMLQSFKHIFCQTQSAASLIQSYGINNVSVSGDTRYDNVIERSKNIKIDLIIEEFCKANSFVIVAGSSYKPEEELLKHVLIKLKGKIKIIVAPHFVSPSRIDEIKTTFNRFNYQVLSQSSSLNSNTDVLIIDSIGKLIGAYKYAKLAFVGGGFNKGNLHNILEPAVFGLPICFGPEIDRFPEACILFDNKLAFKVKDSTTLLTFIESYLNDNNKLAEDKMKIQNFVYDNHGSAQKIIDKLKYDFSLL